MSSQFAATHMWTSIVDIFVNTCPRRNHTRRLTVIESSFSGKEAVQHLLKSLPINPYTQEKLTKEQAAKILQKMLKEKVFHQVAAKSEKKFRETVLYRFTAKGSKISEETIETPRVAPSPVPTIESTAEEKPLNKVDLWNIYSSCFFTRLAEILPSHDFFFSLGVQGSVIQENAAATKTSSPFPEPVMSQIGYLTKLPFSLENPNAVKVLDHLCDSFSSSASLLTRQESAALLDIFDEISSGKFHESNAKECLYAAVSLFLLTLPMLRRCQLKTLLHLMSKISRDDPSGATRNLVLERLSRTIIPCDTITPRQAKVIVQVLMTEGLFVVDRDLLRMADEEKQKILAQRISDSIPKDIVPEKTAKPVLSLAPKRRGRNELFDIISMLGEMEAEGEVEGKSVLKKKAIRRNESSKKSFFRRVFKKI